MGNSRPVGVAYSDPDLDGGTQTGVTLSAPTISSPTLSGGTINNTPIGGTTPAAVAATTLSASGNASLLSGIYIKTSTVAAAGSVQGDAAALSDGFNLVSAADGTKGVKLPAAVAGRVVIIKNNTSAQVLKVWPSSGDAINAVTADSNDTMAGLTAMLLVAYDATTWYSIPLLAS